MVLQFSLPTRSYQKSGLLKPLVLLILTLVTLPLMFTQLIIAVYGAKNGLSSLQIAILFSNGPVVLSFLGCYSKCKAEHSNAGFLLCTSTTSLAVLTALLSWIPLSPSFYCYLPWLLIMSLISCCCFFSQLSCYAILSYLSSDLPPGIVLIDLSQAMSALLGTLISYQTSTQYGIEGMLNITSLCTILPIALYWLNCKEEISIPSFVNPDYKEMDLRAEDVSRDYLADERLKHDLSKDRPYCLMENDTFGKSLIDTDAQVIIIVNIIYVVMVAISHGIHCFFLITLIHRSGAFTFNRCCFLYMTATVLSSAGCTLVRPVLIKPGICNKVLMMLYFAISNIVSLFVMSDVDAHVGKYLISYCCIITNCLLMEELIEGLVTNYYDNLVLPALKIFNVKDYINSKVGFLHGIGAMIGPLMFGAIASDLEVDGLIFTVAAIFTTLTVVTTPLSLLFVAADLR